MRRMSYVGPPFQHDLFVSYSHGADAAGQPMLADWSRAFVRALEKELRAEPAFRNTLSLFMDASERPGQKLDPMQPLTEQLQSNVGAAALLLVLMSPDTQRSRWCADERRWWTDQQAALGLPTGGRVALVKAWPVDAADWPDGRWPTELSDRAGQPLTGFPFHDGAAFGPRPLGWTQWQAGFDPTVLGKVLDLARELFRHLADVKAAADRLRAAQADQQRLADSGGQTVYLHGRVERQDDWERAAEALQTSGYVVMPGSPDPVPRDPAEGNAIREQRVALLAESDALLLLASPDARAVDGDLVVVGKQDRHSARARSQRRLPCALLDTVGPALASTVRRTNARILQADWLDVTQEPLAPVVQRWLGAQAAAGGGGGGGGSGGPGG